MRANFVKHSLNFRVFADKVKLEKARLPDKFDQRHDNSPGMRSMTQDAFKEYFSNDLFELDLVDIFEQEDDQRAEPESVPAREPEMKSHSRDEMVLSYDKR